VVIEKDDRGFYAWYPELKGCQSQGSTLEEANIKEAIELYLEALRRCPSTIGISFLAARRSI
jgi:predicted RNase H-like HicB family nuclease